MAFASSARTSHSLSKDRFPLWRDKILFGCVFSISAFIHFLGREQPNNTDGEKGRNERQYTYSLWRPRPICIPALISRTAGGKKSGSFLCGVRTCVHSLKLGGSHNRSEGGPLRFLFSPDLYSPARICLVRPDLSSL